MAVRVRGNAREGSLEKARFTGEKPSLFLYGGVGMIALLKDLLDLIGIGSLPGIGTIITICFTFLIWILLAVFVSSSRGTRSNMMITRGLVVIFLGMVEALGFGLNFLPIETAMVFVMYQLARKAWKEAKKEAEKEGQSSTASLQRERSEEVRQARAEARAQQEESSPEREVSEQSLMQERSPVPLMNEKYQQFANREKARWVENGQNPLIEAGRAKQFAETDFRSEQQSFEKYRERVEGLRSHIDEKKSSLIGRVMNLREIQGLERELRIAERSQKSAEQMMKSREELFTAYELILFEQQKLALLAEEAQKEKVEWNERKRLEFIEEEKKRDVSNLARTHNTYFVHDIIDAEWKPSANNRAINTKNLTWNDQLDILIGLHPSISVSTIDQGSAHRTFGGEGSWGAFISGGRVLGGGRDDLGTVATGLRDRRFMSKKDTTTEAIEDAIKGREGTHYNELVVEQPEVAGVYCRWSKKMPPLTEETSLQNGNGVRYDSWWASMQDVMDRNIPIFVIDTNNQTHLIHDIDIKKRTFKVARSLTPEDIQNMPGIYKQHIGFDAEKAAVGRVFDSVLHLLTDEEKSKFTPVQSLKQEEIPDPD